MSRHKARRKGGARERVFGCDLLQLLQRSGQDVPQVLRSCTEFVEQHGVVDGIYRLSGVSSNIQRLRQEFESERCPDLRRDVYLQDIHCVSSLCKAYCRELPNPLLTYQLYHKFADAVAIQMEEARLVKIKEVLKELPVPHYRTLEFLMRHLLRMAAHSSRTNMHARNLAIVWAPNLLRSKDIEASGFNGTAAFMEVRVQSIVVEFILTHVEQLFGDAPLQAAESPRRSLLLAGGGQPPPYHVPAALSQGDGPPPIRPYHTIIELSDHRRKGSLKARKWRSIFHLGRSSHEAKRKVKALEEKEDKCGARSLRPAKSMDSLSAVPSTGDGAGDPCPEEPHPGKPPQRRESFDSCPVPPGHCREPGEGREEPPEQPQGDGSAHSEPSTPRAGRSRAQKGSGVHISMPFLVSVPPHITANLCRLTRGLPCPALGTGALAPQPDAGGDAPEPVPPSPAAGSRLSMELRDSFAFLDTPEPWLEGAGEQGERELAPGTAGEGEGLAASEDGMESGCMNPGEPPAEPPCSYLSIEECMDEMFFLAPDDTDSDELFLSAHDDLSPLAAAPEPPGSPVPAAEDAPGAGDRTAAPGTGGHGARTDPGSGARAGAGPGPDASHEDVEEAVGEPGAGEPQPEAPAPLPCGGSAGPGRPEPPVLPEPAAVLRLATRAAAVLQARSVPVVPPKPHFATAPPGPAGQEEAEEEAAAPEGPPVAPGPALRRAGWRARGSASLDAEQPPGRAPVRRSRTYGGGEPGSAGPAAAEPGGSRAGPRRAVGPGAEGQ
ncbi:rho GTPase-activating protein 30 isoform X1 [Lathamus discolor]|uniref:rho GTPase-activating protein 30 isoform X1 n=1 Tax=Lathamus discolor TaxID=678569 RepID=UPI0032B8042B